MTYTRKLGAPTSLLNGYGKFDLCIEIGVFEGQTSNYIAKELLNDDGRLICIDPLEDCYLNDNLNEADIKGNATGWQYFKGQYDRFISNTKPLIDSGKIQLIRKLSKDAFTDLKEYINCVDFIYIDGDHREEGVYLDGKECLKLCKPGGYMLFDDYGWRGHTNDYPTKAGIDRFMDYFDGQYKCIQSGYQLLLQKI